MDYLDDDGSELATASTFATAGTAVSAGNFGYASRAEHAPSHQQRRADGLPYPSGERLWLSWPDGGRWAVTGFPIPPRVVVHNPRPRGPNVAVRAECLRRFRASGLSAEAFAAAEGLRFATLQRPVCSAAAPTSTPTRWPS